MVLAESKVNQIAPLRAIPPQCCITHKQIPSLWGLEFQHQIVRINYVTRINSFNYLQTSVHNRSFWGSVASKSVQQSLDLVCGK